MRIFEWLWVVLLPAHIAALIWITQSAPEAMDLPICVLGVVAWSSAGTHIGRVRMRRRMNHD